MNVENITLKKDEQSSEEKRKIEKNRVIKRIDEENEKKALLEQLQIEFSLINKTVTRCVDLMSSAVQSEKTPTLYEDLHNLNNRLYKESHQNFESDLSNVNEKLNKYYEELKNLKDAENKEKKTDN